MVALPVVRRGLDRAIPFRQGALDLAQRLVAGHDDRACFGSSQRIGPTLGRRGDLFDDCLHITHPALHQPRVAQRPPRLQIVLAELERATSVTDSFGVAPHVIVRTGSLAEKKDGVARVELDRTRQVCDGCRQISGGG